MIRTAEKPLINPVAEAARAALETAGGDTQAAAQALEEAVRRDASLFERIMDPLLKKACEAAIRDVLHDARDRAWRAPTEKLRPTGVTGAHRVVLLAAGNLAMFPLPGGRRLCEASRAEIAAAAAFYEKQSNDMARKARWLRLVAQSVPDGRRVGDMLSEGRLRELQDEARHSE